jgi:hypothetical protein
MNRRSFELFAEVLLIGVLVCVAALPLVTALAALAAGATVLRELTETGQNPTARRFLGVLAYALRDPVALAAPVVLAALGTLDALALLGGVPGAGVLGPVIGVVLVALVVVGLRGAVLWRPGERFRAVLATAALDARRDWYGTLLLGGGLVVVVLVGTWLPAFFLILPGLLALAAVAVTGRKLG